MAFYNENGENFDEMFVKDYEFIDNMTIAGSLISCGYNGKGQLGINSTTTSNYSTFQTVPSSINGIKQIACGKTNTFVLKTDGTLLSCGYNGSGQLGLGNTTQYSTFQTVPTITGIKQVACGPVHTIALKTDGTVLACGTNNAGRAGLGSTSSVSTFTAVSSITSIKQIACGYAHTFVLKTDGTLLSCGDNTYGQLGINSTTTSQYSTFQTVPGITNIKQVACGDNYTVALKNDGTLLACGTNGYGQLGINSTTTSNYSTFQTVPGITDIKQVACGLTHTFVLKTDGTLLSCGRNVQGALGINSTTTSNYSTFQTVPNVAGIKQVSCGVNSSYAVALKTDGTLLACGRNNYGQLGINSTTTSIYSTFQTVPSITGIKQVSCGQSTTIASLY